MPRGKSRPRQLRYKIWPLKPPPLRDHVEIYSQSQTKPWRISLLLRRNLAHYFKRNTSAAHIPLQPAVQATSPSHLRPRKRREQQAFQVLYVTRHTNTTKVSARIGGLLEEISEEKFAAALRGRVNYRVRAGMHICGQWLVLRCLDHPRHRSSGVECRRR